ncbi:SDR family oxidoreductase [Solimonas marina]|uniref:SDR family oxidoreductase n=1 Tax=Solimonas marina TaxID=2714601 RepID=A0A969W729_9GAMM|nr:SDR family oxidoreductase [Solimonas marina]NKF20734.1 SDR family oxidoreductase [Solimonas marina]
MSVSFDFRGKHVFVAGGTSGINLGVAHAFARSGARVSVLSRSQDKVDAAVTALKRTGGDAAGFSADVRDYAKTEEALKAAHAKFGEIDVLISGAAGNFPAPALGISSNGFRAVVEIDLLGTFHVLRAAYPLVKKPGASIINISAPQAFLPMEMQMHVCAAKAGVDMVTRVGALEWGAAGVRVNSVVPGPIDETEGMARLAPTPETRQSTIESVPMQRYGTKQDIANACLWLASDAASYVSGAIIPVDGGWSLGGATSLGTNMKKLLASDS